jgi:chromosome partitioning protein
MTRYIAVVNLKGGTSKTTTTGYIGAALHERGHSVLGVDADGENQGLLAWSEAGPLDFPVIGQPTASLHTTLPGIAGDRYEWVVMDTPPMQAQKGTVSSAIRLADLVVITSAPNKAEWDRVAAVVDVVRETGPLRADGPALFAVLFTRCKGGTASPAAYRMIAEEQGYPVFDTKIGHHEYLSLAQDTPITRVRRTAYWDFVDELGALLDVDVTPRTETR